MRVSKYLSYKEVTKSLTAKRLGFANKPDEAQLKNIIEWARNIFDPVRSFIYAPLGVHSVFRDVNLNQAIGGARHSQHMAYTGAAGDIDCQIYGNATNKIIFSYILKNLSFDQMIAEFKDDEDGDISWVHVSYVSVEENRNQVLIATKDENNKTKYLTYTEKLYKEIYG